ncbi:MAG: DNA alkylation repair protein [Sulfurimonas sp.]|nr:DNA alkylation repair protein [Sulfurimonas sp.]
MKEKFEMKAAAFNEKNISSLADSILDLYPEFNHKEFLELILPNLDALELKERSSLIEDTLVTLLPEPFEKGVNILLQAMPKEITDDELSGFDGFIMMPQTGYVARCGMDNFKLSMKVLYEMTKRFTAEFHIRYFILEHYESTMQMLERWADDENVHVRRLVSEGTRPRLPWAFALKNFKKDPTPVIELLERLKNDPELYVRRSVANNLNDISKDHPELVTKTLDAWQDGTKEMTWLSKHALRTLLKSGNTEALALFGFVHSDKLDVNLSLKKKEVIFGEYLEFEIELNSNEENILPVMIDFIIYYKKANKTLAPKVFKLSSKIIKPNEKLNIVKKHKFADFSTRKHYAGEHQLAIIVNGKAYNKCSFNLNIT